MLANCQCFGKLGLALAGKAKGQDTGGWYDVEIGAQEDPKSISHEHTFGEDTADQGILEATIARLSEMVGRRLRDHGFHARTVQLKLRYKDFTTITRAKSLPHSTQLDTEVVRVAKQLFRTNWKGGATVRLLGVHVSGFDGQDAQMDLLEGEQNDRLRKVFAAADKMRNRFGADSVSLAGGMRGKFREKAHEAMPKESLADIKDNPK